jgi:hypothetical protein
LNAACHAARQPLTRGCPRWSPSGCSRARSNRPAPGPRRARRLGARAPPPGFRARSRSRTRSAAPLRYVLRAARIPRTPTDERWLTAGIQIYGTRVHGRYHGGPADVQKRPSGRHQHVAGPQQLAQRPRAFHACDGRLQFDPVAYLREPGGHRAQPVLVTARKDRAGPSRDHRPRSQRPDKARRPVQDNPAWHGINLSPPRHHGPGRPPASLLAG